MRIKDFIDYEQPNEYIVESDRYSSKYSTPVLTAGQFFILGYTNESKGIYKKGPCIIFDDFTTSVHYVDFPFKVKSSAMKILTTKSIADLKYCYYLLLSLSKMPPNHKRQWISTTSEKNHLLPSIDKQISIVKQLDLISDTIAYYSKQIEHLDNLVKARFVEMFGDPLINTKKWKECTIGELATDVRYGTSKPSVDGGKYPYLRMNNLTNNGELDLTDLKYIDVSDDEKEKCVVRKGDILFNRTNSIDLVGKTTLFNLDEEMIIAGYIIRVRLNSQILPEILAQYMNSSALKKLLRKMAKGAVNQANINAQELQSIKVYVPDLELQNRFSSFVQQVDKSKFHCFHQKIRETFQVSQKLTFLLKFYSTCVLWYKVIQYATSIFRQRLLIHIQEGNEYHHLISSYIVP